MTHRRQTIRETAAAAIAGIPATVDQERAARANEAARPLVVVRAVTDAMEEGAGIMGDPTDNRTLALAFDLYTDGETGKIAVDGINDLDEAIGVALGVALGADAFSNLLLDLRWTSTDIELNADQDRFMAFGTVTYSVTYAVYFGAPT